MKEERPNKGGKRVSRKRVPREINPERTCESTARSAYMRDFKVAFISDANGGFDQSSHQTTLNISNVLMVECWGRRNGFKRLSILAANHL
jgi:hypothetical protein